MEYRAKTESLKFREPSPELWVHRVGPVVFSVARENPFCTCRINGISLLEARLASRNHSTDPNELSPQDEWKAMFQCSLFGSLAQKASL